MQIEFVQNAFSHNTLPRAEPLSVAVGSAADRPWRTPRASDGRHRIVRPLTLHGDRNERGKSRQEQPWQYDYAVPNLRCSPGDLPRFC